MLTVCARALLRKLRGATAVVGKGQDKLQIHNDRLDATRAHADQTWGQRYPGVLALLQTDG